jgi:L-aminopeptidase/D-esterase-like protein
VAGDPAAAGETPARFAGAAGTNTTLALVATDAPLTKAGARALATAAHAGIARVVRPSHTPFDGDATFVLSTGEGAPWPPARLAAAVQQVVARALAQGARAGQAA